MDTLTEVRQQLDTLLAQITIDHQALDKRERQLAQAAEQLNQEAAVRAAWQQGGRHERNRVTALIDLQLDQLTPRRSQCRRALHPAPHGAGGGGVKFPPLDQQNCGNCRYSRYRLGSASGHCHRHAPQIGPRGSEWPTVAASDWCGEWAATDAKFEWPDV
jgi:hypothetical protein